jgi:hypothetical protein
VTHLASPIHTFTLMSIASVFCLSVACSDDGVNDDGQRAAESKGDDQGTDEPKDEPVEETPAYVVGSRIWDDVGTTSYFHVLPSLDEGTRVDEDRAMEVAGAAKLFAIPDLGWFAIGGGDDATITRYTLDGDALQPLGDPINLAGYGIASFWDTLYVVSPTKMYYPDREGRQLIVINPRAMKIEGTVDLSETERDGYLSLFGYAPIVRGDRLLFTVGWFDWNETDSVLGETGLVTINTETDEVEGFEVDTRCGGVTQPVSDESGDTYLVSSALAAAAHELGRLPTAPCALRILDGADTFDADYFQELLELSEGSLVGEPIPGADSRIILRVFDGERGEVAEDMATWELTGQAVWSWNEWDPATGEMTRLDTLEPSTSDVVWFNVEGGTIGAITKADYSETKLVDFTAEGGPREAVTVPGFVHGVARVR